MSRRFISAVTAANNKVDDFIQAYENEDITVISNCLSSDFIYEDTYSSDKKTKEEFISGFETLFNCEEIYTISLNNRVSNKIFSSLVEISGTVKRSGKVEGGDEYTINYEIQFNVEKRDDTWYITKLADNFSKLK